jgi:uncharacterized repeat protein (TIGR01451 family)
VRWSGAAVVTTGVLFGSIQSAMAAPSANTQIGNQAVASYVDGAGLPQTSRSNTVTTVVQQVGSFTLESNGAKSAAAGNTAYISHTLVNTGNGQDNFTIVVAEANGAAPNFTSMKLFLDADGNGLPDSSTELPPTVTVPGQNGVFKFVVEYAVPNTATTLTWPSNQATVTVTAGLTSIYNSGDEVKTNTDTVTLTDQASFNVTTAIGQPNIAGVQAWNTPLASGPAASSKTVYTVNFNNSGGAGAPLYVELTLPAGLVYTTGTAAWSSLPGVALTDSDADAAQSGGTATIDYRVAPDGKTIRAFISNVGPNVAGTLSFNVDISPAAPVGTSQTTLRTKYNSGACATPPASLNDVATACSAVLVDANTSAFTVTATYGVKFGVRDTVAGVPVVGDIVTVAGAVPGMPADFTQVIENMGNAPDTFNLYVNAVTPASYTAFPPGTTYTWYSNIGVSGTPLGDTNNDGVVDTGPIAAGASTAVFLRITVPTGTPISSGANYAVDAYAVSINDGAQVDAIRANQTAVLGGLVDIRNVPNSMSAGDAGPGPGTVPAFTVSREVGKLAVFPLQVTNGGTGSATYNLAVSQTSTFPGTLPAGWTVTFSSDAACTALTTITQITVSSNASEPVWACVNTSSSASPVIGQALYFQVKDSVSTTTVADVLRNAIDLLPISRYTFSATGDNVGQAAASGSVTYSHTIANTGNQTCFVGQNLRITPTVTAGWNYSLYIDVNEDGEIDPGDTLITDPANVPVSGGLLPGADIKILVRMFAPGSASSGSAGVLDLKLEDTTTPTPCVYAGTDLRNITTVIVGMLRVYKTQVKVADCNALNATGFSAESITAKPGECVAYQVIAKNEGDSVVREVFLTDNVPGNTNYEGGVSGSPVVIQPQPSSQCEGSGISGGSASLMLGSAPVKTLTCGTFGSLSPLGTITLRFAVQVDP